MKALRVLPNQEPVEIDISGSLESLQKEVGGYIDVVRLDAEVDAFVNDEGLLVGLPYNRKVGQHHLVGPIVILSHDGEGESKGLTDAQVAEWKQYFALGKAA
jgi:hypothetical protein